MALAAIAPITPVRGLGLGGPVVPSIPLPVSDGDRFSFERVLAGTADLAETNLALLRVGPSATASLTSPGDRILATLAGPLETAGVIPGDSDAGLALARTEARLARAQARLEEAEVHLEEVSFRLEQIEADRLSRVQAGLEKMQASLEEIRPPTKQTQAHELEKAQAHLEEVRAQMDQLRDEFKQVQRQLLAEAQARVQEAQVHLQEVQASLEEVQDGPWAADSGSSEATEAARQWLVQVAG